MNAGAADFCEPLTIKNILIVAQNLPIAAGVAA
jgi:hypothetical protein